MGFLRCNLYDNVHIYNRAVLIKEFEQFAYFSLVRSKLEYVCASWDPHLIKDIQCLDKVQWRGARFVCSDYRRDNSVTGILDSRSWLANTGRKMDKLALKYDEQDYWWQSTNTIT